MLVEFPISITVTFNINPEYLHHPDINEYISKQFSTMLAEFKTEFLHILRYVLNAYGIHKAYGRIWATGSLDKISEDSLNHITVDFSRLKARLNIVGDGIDCQISTNVKIIYRDDTPINTNIKRIERIQRLIDHEIDEDNPFNVWDEEWNELDEEEKLAIRNEFMKDVQKQLRIAIQFTMNRMQWSHRDAMRHKPFDQNYSPVFQGAAAYRFDPIAPEAINIESRTRRRAIQGIARPSTGKPISRNLPQNEASRIANFVGGPLGPDPEGLPAALSIATLRQPFEYRVALAEEARKAEAAQALEAARQAAAAAAPPAKKKAWWNPFGGKRLKTHKTRKTRKTRGRRYS
jgi:hypothetical protein